MIPRQGLALLLSVFPIACAMDARPVRDSSVAVTLQSKPTSAPPRRIHTDSANLACRRDTVVAASASATQAAKVGTQLRIPLRGNRIALLHDCRVDDDGFRDVAVQAYHPAAGAFFVRDQAWEAVSFYWMDDSTAERHPIYGLPHFAPDSTRFLTWKASDWPFDVFEPAKLDIWVIDDQMPRREYEVVGDSAGPEHPVWSDSATIDFWRVTWRGHEKDSTRARLLRDGTRWKVEVRP